MCVHFKKYSFAEVIMWNKINKTKSLVGYTDYTDRNKINKTKSLVGSTDYTDRNKINQTKSLVGSTNYTDVYTKSGSNPCYEISTCI